MHILSIDDDANDKALFERVIRSECPGCTFENLNNGDSVLAYLNDRNPAAPTPRLILLDIKMPVYNGLEILKYIRNLKHMQSIPVVVFSSSKDEKEIKTTFELGANSFVEKPKDFLELKKVLPEIVNYWIYVNKYIE